MRTLKHRRNAGGILIYMLGVISLLSLVVTEFLLEVSAEIRYRSQVTNREDLSVVSYSALQVAMGVLNDVDRRKKGLHSPADGWRKPLKYIPEITFPDGYTVEVTILDETGKVSLYSDDEELLNTIWDQFDASLAIRDDLKDGLRTFLETELKEVHPEKDTKKKKEEGVEKTEGGVAIPGKTKSDQKNKDKDSKKELRQITSMMEFWNDENLRELLFNEPGEPNDAYKWLERTFSIYHREKPNVNTASNAMKELWGAEINEDNDPEPTIYRSSDDLIFNAGAKSQSEPYGFEARVLDIRINVSRGPVTHLLNAIITDESSEGGDESSDKDAKNKAEEEEKAIGNKYRVLALTEDYLVLE